MIVLGFDPDTKTTGFAMMRDKTPLHARLLAVPNRREPIATRRLKMVEVLSDFLSDFRIENPDAMHVDRIVVEGQRIRAGGRARPQDIVHLAQMAGAIVGACRMLWPQVEILVPEPQDWKGTVRKDVFTRRILRNLMLEHQTGGLYYAGGHVRVPGTVNLKQADVTHVVDALGLALWGVGR